MVMYDTSMVGIVNDAICSNNITRLCLRLHASEADGSNLGMFSWPPLFPHIMIEHEATCRLVRSQG